MKYSIDLFERALTFQITRQEDAVTEFVKKPFKTSNGWTIVSSDVPELDIFNKIIYLRGADKEGNLRVDRRWNLPSNWARDSYAAQIDGAIKELLDAVYEPKPAATERGVIGYHTSNVSPAEVKLAAEADDTEGKNIATKPEVSA